jgi:hypothetical protein
MSRKNLIPSLLLPAIVTAMPAYSQTAVPVPTAKEIIELAKKAVGGNAYFEIKPYTFTYVNELEDTDPKTVKSTAFYKDGKYREDCSITKKWGFKFSSVIITDVKKKETWESQSSLFKGKFKKIDFRSEFENTIPFYKSKLWDACKFDSPVIIKENGVNCYKLFSEHPYSKEWDYTLFINCDNYLVYKAITNKKSSYTQTEIFDDYKKYQGIMIPQQITTIHTSIVRGKSSEVSSKMTITSFTFKNDIADSLFVVPK